MFIIFYLEKKLTAKCLFIILPLPRSLFITYYFLFFPNNREIISCFFSLYSKEVENVFFLLYKDLILCFLLLVFVLK